MVLLWASFEGLRLRSFIVRLVLRFGLKVKGWHLVIRQISCAFPGFRSGGSGSGPEYTEQGSFKGSLKLKTS